MASPVSAATPKPAVPTTVAAAAPKPAAQAPVVQAAPAPASTAADAPRSRPATAPEALWSPAPTHVATAFATGHRARLVAPHTRHDVAPTRGIALTSPHPASTSASPAANRPAHAAPAARVLDAAPAPPLPTAPTTGTGPAGSLGGAGSISFLLAVLFAAALAAWRRASTVLPPGPARPRSVDLVLLVERPG